MSLNPNNALNFSGGPGALPGGFKPGPTGDH
jgi:hypothetical protein